jgi:hypothetical protein
MAMTDEEIQAFVTRTVQGAITPLGDQMRGITTALESLKPKPADDAAAAAKAAADKAAADKVAADAAAAAAKTGLTPEANAQMLDMRRSNEALVAQMASLTKEREADKKRADDSERMSAVTAALSGFQFASESARQTAVEKLLPQIKRTETGALVAGDNLTPEAFIKDFLPTQHAYLLAPVNTGGSGVTPGGNHGPSKAVDLNSIKPGMSVDDNAAARAAIAQTLGLIGR